MRASKEVRPVGIFPEMHARSLSWLLFSLIGLVYLLLVAPTAGRQGISWDEQNDIAVARSYLRSGGWLSGSEVDPSQTRLPMAAVAVAYRVLGVTDLLTARLMSVAAGLLTILGVYVYASGAFGRPQALLTCVLLAASPFFLSFARVAFTETDIYVACALAWLLESVRQLQLKRTLGRAAAVAVVFGLALSAKATMLAVLPAIWFAVLDGEPVRIPGREVSKHLVFTLAAALLPVTIAGLVLYLPADGFHQRLLLFLAVLAAWLGMAGWMWVRQDRTANPLEAALLITGLAGLTFFVLPPEHVGNPRILHALLWRAEHEMAFRPGFMVEAAALHLFSILFKSSPLVGAGLFAGVGYAVLRWRIQAYRFPLLVILAYFSVLVFLPLAQTFYAVPLLPLLSVLAAGGFFALLARWKRTSIALALLAALVLVADLYRCYPDYNLNGYQWLGARPLAGRPSIGYRSVIQTPSDGVEQAFSWLNENARPGERVASYALERHILEAVAPDRKYVVENALEKGPFPDAEYVVTSVNTDIPQSWWTGNSSPVVIRPPYDLDWLKRRYEKVFAVTRAFGIEMSSVWKKRQ